MTAPAVWDQDSFRGYADDAALESATAKAAINVGWTQDVNENFRIRFLIQETGGTAESGVEFQLQYNLASAGWNDVNASSSVVRCFASTHFADDAATAQLIGSGSNNAGLADEVDGLVGDVAQNDYLGNDEGEFEFCVQIRSGDVTDAQTLQLRLIEGFGAALDTYTNTPTITVNEPPTIEPPISTGVMMPDQTPTASHVVAAIVAVSMLTSVPPPEPDTPGRVISFVPSVKVLGYQYHNLPSQPYEWSSQPVPPDVIAPPQDLPEGMLRIPDKIAFIERPARTAYDAQLSTFVVGDEPEPTQILPIRINDPNDIRASGWAYNNNSLSELVIVDEPPTATQLYPIRTLAPPRADITAHQIAVQFTNPDEAVTTTIQVMPSRTIGHPRACVEAYVVSGETFPSPDRPLTVQAYPQQTYAQQRASAWAYSNVSQAELVIPDEPPTATQLFPQRTQEPLRAASSTYFVNTRLIEPDETQHTQRLPDRTQSPLRASLEAYTAKYPTFPVIDAPVPTQILPDRTRAPGRAAETAYEIIQTFVVADIPPTATQYLPAQTFGQPRSSNESYIVSLSELTYEDPVKNQFYPDRTFGAERAAEEAYSGALSPVVYEETIHAQTLVLLPDRTLPIPRAAQTAYEVQYASLLVSGEEQLFGSRSIPNRTQAVETPASTAFDPQLATFVIPGEPEPTQSLPDRTQRALRPAVTAYEITQTWFDVQESVFPRGDVLVPDRTQSPLRVSFDVYSIVVSTPPPDEPSTAPTLLIPDRTQPIPRSVSSNYFISASIPGADVTELIPDIAQMQFRMQPARFEFAMVENRFEFRAEEGRFEFVIEEL